MLLPLMAAAALVTLPSGVTAEDYTMIATFKVLNETTQEFDEKSRTANVKVAVDGDDIYVSGLSYTFPNAYIKGTIEGNMATFPSGQMVGSDLFNSTYLCGIILKDNEIANNEIILSYSTETRSLAYNSQVGVMIAESAKADAKEDKDILSYLTAASFSVGALAETPVEAPENLDTETYLFTATYLRYETDENQQEQLVTEDYQSAVKIGFDGNDIYIQGISEYAPNGWAKATKNSAGQYVIPANQYMAFVDLLGLGQLIRHYYIAAIDRQNNLLEVVLDFDAKNIVFTTDQTIVINGSKTGLQPYNFYRDMKFQIMVESEATPSAPKFTFNSGTSYSGLSTEYTAEIFVPLLDTEGNPMLAEKLSFQFLREKDGVTEPVVFKAANYRNLKNDAVELPYGFTDGYDFSSHTIYFDPMGEEELKTWTKLGMQSIYRGLDIEHKSEITWVDLTKFWATSISHIDATPVADRYYDLQGRCVPASTKGLLLRRTILSDGTVVTKKMLRK